MGKMENSELMMQFQQELPALFAATELDRLTGKAVRWATIQNKRLKADGPPESCFRKDGCRKILIVRDEFIKWWLETLR